MAPASALPKSLLVIVSGLLGLILLVLHSYLPESHTKLPNIPAPNEVDSRTILSGTDEALPLIPQNHSSLVRRDDYSCGPGKPCANGACCGVSGYCGYGKETSVAVRSEKVSPCIDKNNSLQDLPTAATAVRPIAELWLNVEKMQARQGRHAP